MVSELVFLLLIVGVLGALALSAFLHATRSSDRPAAADDPLAVHEASYLRYLAYVPERPEGEADPLAAAKASHRSAERRAARQHPADATPRFPASSRSSGGSAAASSTLVPSATGSSASRVEAEDDLEVIIVNVTGEGQAAAGSGAGPGPPARGAQSGGEEEAGAADGSKTLLLMAAPAAVNEQAKAQAIDAMRQMVADQTEGEGGRRHGGSARRVEFRSRSADVWKRWPDANVRKIVGTDGADALNRAFDLLEDSDAHPIADDLFRKGIPIAFGEPSEFAGDHSGAAAFLYPATRPPDEPVPPPAIHLNPKFLQEDPRVLAAVLAHEGTHFQQYLEGRFRYGVAEEVEFEARAWLNGAVMWQQVRRSALSFQTPLVRDLEVGYQMARRGEGLLHDFVAALYAH